MINILEQVHKAGYIYNDLKLDNFLLGYREQLPKNISRGNCFENVNINLIDFGLTDRYIDVETGKHKPSQEMNQFKGNLLFSSQYQLSFQTPS
jgi:serine/threonine protein kinase